MRKRLVKCEKNWSQDRLRTDFTDLFHRSYHLMTGSDTWYSSRMLNCFWSCRVRDLTSIGTCCFTSLSLWFHPFQVSMSYFTRSHTSLKQHYSVVAICTHTTAKQQNRSEARTFLLILNCHEGSYTTAERQGQLANNIQVLGCSSALFHLFLSRTGMVQFLLRDVVYWCRIGWYSPFVSTAQRETCLHGIQHQLLAIPRLASAGTALQPQTSKYRG
jgi:hypothetical protein